MTFSAGTLLGTFEILSPLGAGGMGEVWRARDTRLGREVALKVLPADVAEDPVRLARSEREAKVLASLNHPNIATLFGLETVRPCHPERSGLRGRGVEGSPEAQSDDPKDEAHQTSGDPSTQSSNSFAQGDMNEVTFLVMELVEGEDLSERISRGPIPIDEAIPIALQIAEALEAAHEAGIVHRDLKPANIMVTEDGAVKVLDFGLAKVWESDAPSASSSLSPTLTRYTAVEGVILGTAGYMSPEQARGKRVDRRADIWAFGVVLWEMLTGRRLYEGESVPDVLAAVLNEQPDLDRLPTETPPRLRDLVARCLVHDPKERLRDIGEARIALREGGGGGRVASHPDMVDHTGAVQRSASAALRTSWLISIAFGIVAAAFALLWLNRPAQDQDLVQSVIEPPAGASISPRSGFALSPDGRQLALVARDADGVRRLWIRSLDSLESRELPGTEGALSPFWSPDGRDLGFFATGDDQMKRVPATGGQVRIVAAANHPAGGTWGANDRVVFAPNNRIGLFEVSANGGEPRALTQLDSDSGELSHRWPVFLPDGTSVMFLAQTGDAGSTNDRSRIKIVDAEGGQHAILYENTSAAVARPDWLLFWRQGSLHAQKLNMEKWQLEGDPRRVAGDVGFSAFENASFSVGSRDTLVYHREVEAPWRLEWRSRLGRLLEHASPPGGQREPVLSPDGGRVAYVEDRAVWVRDLERDTTTRLSFEDADHYSAHWSPDGNWLVYARDGRDGIGGEMVRRRSSGVGEAKVLYASDRYLYVNSISQDGRLIAFDEAGDISIFDLDSGVVTATISTTGGDYLPDFSPDGRWLAFQSNESGRDEIYVVPVAGGPGRWQVSSRGGQDPEWGPRGDELFYLGFDAELRVVGVDLSGSEPRFGTPEPLFSIRGDPGRVTFEVARDGRILVLSQPEAAPVVNLTLVQNWSALLADERR